MKLLVVASATMLLTLISGPLSADDAVLQRQITELSKRVEVLEAEVRQLSGKDKWRDPIYWQTLKMDMPEADVIKLLGKPARVEEQIFTTWYYHKTSKLHSFVWFDRGKVLGWELPR